MAALCEPDAQGLVTVFDQEVGEYVPIKRLYPWGDGESSLLRFLMLLSRIIPGHGLICALT